MVTGSQAQCTFFSAPALLYQIHQVKQDLEKCLGTASRPTAAGAEEVADGEDGSGSQEGGSRSKQSSSAAHGKKQLAGKKLALKKKLWTPYTTAEKTLPDYCVCVIIFVTATCCQISGSFKIEFQDDIMSFV